jgi:hypothetical protein
MNQADGYFVPLVGVMGCLRSFVFQERTWIIFTFDAKILDIYVFFLYKLQQNGNNGNFTQNICVVGIYNLPNTPINICILEIIVLIKTIIH